MKRALVWLSGFATLALVLYVRHEYNVINQVNSDPSQQRAAQLTQAQAVRAEKPAQAKEAVADETFMGLPWGSDEKAILMKFGGKVKKLDEREDFAFWYVDNIIPDFDMDGVPMEVHFQMDKDTHRLTQVLLRKMAEDKPLGVYADDFKSLTLSRMVLYGMPQATESGDRNSAFFAEGRKWTRGTTGVSISRTQKAYANGKTSEMLAMRFTQSG